MDKSKKGHSKLIIACSDPAENFKFVEETLNQVEFLIGVEIAEPRLDHIAFGWDRIRCSLLCNSMDFCSLSTMTYTDKLVVFRIYSSLFAPALCGCALILVLSIHRFS